MIYVPSFMIGGGVQAILSVYFGNLRGCDVGNTGGRDS
jgi:hypothetical protein